MNLLIYYAWLQSECYQGKCTRPEPFLSVVWTFLYSGECFIGLSGLMYILNWGAHSELPVQWPGKWAHEITQTRYLPWRGKIQWELSILKGLKGKIFFPHTGVTLWPFSSQQTQCVYVKIQLALFILKLFCMHLRFINTSLDLDQNFRVDLNIFELLDGNRSA